ncbi:hypothetical protein GQ457_16G019240 [Hibiscus cannabinus]
MNAVHVRDQKHELTPPRNRLEWFWKAGTVPFDYATIIKELDLDNNSPPKVAKVAKYPTFMLVVATTFGGRFRHVGALDEVPRPSLSPYRINSPRKPLELDEIGLEPSGSLFVDLHRPPLDGTTSGICCSSPNEPCFDRSNSPSEPTTASARDIQDGCQMGIRIVNCS